MDNKIEKLGDKGIKLFNLIIASENPGSLLQYISNELSEKLKKTQEHKYITFLDTLLYHQESYKPIDIDSHDFLHKFLITAKVIGLTRSNEKIKLLAQFLKDSEIKDSQQIKVDIYEEYLNTIEKISDRGLYVLNQYDVFQKSSKKYSSDYARFENFCMHVTKELDINNDELLSLLSTLSGLGLYNFDMNMRATFGSSKPDGFGSTTTYYKKLKIALRRNLEKFKYN